MTAKRVQSPAHVLGFFLGLEVATLALPDSFGRPLQTAGASQVLPAFQIALRGFFSGATALLLFEAK